MIEQRIGAWLAEATEGFAVIAIVIIRFKSKEAGTQRLSAIVSAVLAYSIYMSGALIVKAPFPQFLRDHLFDGLAPAALVAFVIDRFLAAKPANIFPQLRRPIFILAALFIVSASVSGLIADCAVFSSGSNNYFAIWKLLFLWGAILPIVYIGELTSSDLVKFSDAKWWWRKREVEKRDPAASPEPGGSGP